MNILIFGPNGSGKGTQGALLMEKYGIAHIESGAIFRKHIGGGTELGMKAKAYIDKGELVPDEITIPMVLDILKNQGDQGWLLDGFPRNMEQARKLDEALKAEGMKLDYVVEILLPRSTARDRIMGRRLCVNNNNHPNNIFIDAIKPNGDVCRVCGGELKTRADDQDEAAINKRHDIYYDEVNGTLAAAYYFKDLAAEFNPENVILFYWNANSILTLGDHRYCLDPYPHPEAVKGLKKNGFQWIGFHGYSLLCNEAYIPQRHAGLFKNKVPAGYQFKPDYQGNTDHFFKDMAPYRSIRGKSLSMLNPAAKTVADYLVRNVVNYAKYHDIPGFYLDCVGAVSYSLKPGKKVFEGKTYTEGDAVVLRRIRQTYPDLLLMPEYCGEWVIPYIFYTWENPHNFAPNLRINHPLRGALYGTYFWSRETMEVDDPVANAYYATLPEIVKGSPKLEGALTAPWHIERAKLFIREKLFNALPDVWDPEALAYYRSEKNGFFQFRKMPFGYAYVNENKKPLLGIYENVAKGIPGFMIPYWCAYDAQGRAIGLNPERSYRFIKKADPVPFTVTALTDGAYLEHVRHNRNWTSCRINSKTLKNADLTFHFDKMPVTLLINGKEKNLTGKQMKLSVALPASIVAVYKAPGKQSFAHNQDWAVGYDSPNGLRTSHGFRGYACNFMLTVGQIEFAKEKKNGVKIGPGSYGAYAEKLIRIPTGAKTLKFSYAMKNSLKKKNMRLTVSVNDKILSDFIVKNGTQWQEKQVDISAYAGTQALFSFVFWYDDGKPASHSNNYLYIGNPHFE